MCVYRLGNGKSCYYTGGSRRTKKLLHENDNGDEETAVYERLMERVCTALFKGKVVVVIREALQRRKSWCMKTIMVAKKLPYLKDPWNANILHWAKEMFVFYYTGGINKTGQLMRENGRSDEETARFERFMKGVCTARSKGGIFFFNIQEAAQEQSS